MTEAELDRLEALSFWHTPAIKIKEEITRLVAEVRRLKTFIALKVEPLSNLDVKLEPVPVRWEESSP